MTRHILEIVALVAVVGAGGAVWLLVRDEHGRSRASSAQGLQWLGVSSAVVVLATTPFLRPWTWGVGLAGAVVVGLAGFQRLVGVLEQRPSPAGWGAVAAALASVLVGSGLVTLGGAAVVIDGAALAGGNPAPAAHAGQVLARTVLYQVFWGPVWAAVPAPPALAQAVAFQRALPTSPWGAAVLDAGFGVRSFTSGGCWVDPGPPAEPGGATSTSAGVFPDEIHLALTGHRHLIACPGAPARAVPGNTLPHGALVALWLDPAVPYGLGGVSAHGSVPWPGRPDGLAATGISGGFASWGLPGCRARAACRALPGYATPTYTLSHEVVEATVNPYGHGWFADVPLPWAARYVLSHGPASVLDTTPVFEGEVADLCQPGQPDAGLAGRLRTLVPGDRAPAAFYRPGVGCTT